MGCAVLMFDRLISSHSKECRYKCFCLIGDCDETCDVRTVALVMGTVCYW